MFSRSTYNGNASTLITGYGTPVHAATRIYGGTISCTVDHAVPAYTFTYINPDTSSHATFDLGGHNQNTTFIGGGTITSDTSGVDPTLTATVPAGSYEFGGVITDGTGGPVAITKEGPGTWTLSGPNDYTGKTTVRAEPWRWPRPLRARFSSPAVVRTSRLVFSSCSSRFTCFGLRRSTA